MSTIAKATRSQECEEICQGDIFQNVRYSYIDEEDDEGVNIVEYEFPLAVVISQACDVIAMDNLITNKNGKPAKFMPSVLLCPIYEKNAAKSGDHIKDVFEKLKIKFESENTFQKDDIKVAERDWHYRLHPLTIEVNGEIVLENAIIDNKHYFTVPISYLSKHKKDRILHLDDLFSEQITLKFATYLSRVAIP